MEAVKYDVADGVAHVTLSRPDSLNAVNKDLTRGVEEAFALIAADDDVRAVLLSGEGRSFCAGADLKDPDTHSADDILANLRPGGLDAVSTCPKPIVTAVQGYAIGAGVELVCASDVVIAAEDAVFFLPQVALGIVPGAGGLTRMVRRVGEAWTSRMALLGERVPAETALRIGLVTEVVERDGLVPRAMELAAALAAQPTAAARLAKESILEAQDLPLSSALRVDKYRLFALSGTDEKKQSHAAFANRAKA